ncbi:hypothetical protein PLESTB_001469700 [Pleodorina starrii]|uniref:Chlorophyll b reductase n=1 Tax=Pleodorina starrii TaxID=330485 RepID=A0A9W6F835_9CHLO|nr:hypothetical protein PLESTM_001688000 [Pleodorina starrii]GLC59280.1 hypothetical protein PLESTB_001469700 [Pleodorina starrii]GLC74843.1 hypothetical protein PLESTF_001562200 [Pleodorina starrii]
MQRRAPKLRVGGLHAGAAVLPSRPIYAPKTKTGKPATKRPAPLCRAAGDDDDIAASTSGRSSLMTQLLRGPRPDLFQAHPKIRQLHHILRGNHSHLRGLERPLGTVVLPAYVWATVSSLLGLHIALPLVSGAAVGGLFAAMHRFGNRRLWPAPRRPITVVVTGGTRGLGKALAREFLCAGDRVLITGRSQGAVDAAVEELREEAAAAAAGGSADSRDGGEELGAKVTGVACDVSDPAGVAAVEAAAVAAFGVVDAWVNNAGTSGSFQVMLDQTDEQIEQVVRTNLLGTLLCTRQAISLFSRQPGGGHVFNMDGAGADGFATPNYAAYGATKAGITHLTATLQRELADTPVRLHTVSPGMILTDLLLEGATTANKQAFNILCEHPETVAAFLVPRIKSALARDASGTYTRYLTPTSALLRLVTAPARLGRFFDGAGRAVYPPERDRILGRHSRATARRQAAARRQNGGLALAYNLSVLAGVLVMLAEAPVLRG